MIETCTVAFTKILLQYGFITFMAYDDGITVGQGGKKELPNATNYMALSASTDDFANRMLDIKGYTKTVYTCTIGPTTVPIWVQTKIGEKA